jgi:hypothetical protein
MSQNRIAEATLDELLGERIIKIMMDRDGVTEDEVRRLVTNMKHRLFRPMIADDQGRRSATR